MPHRTIRNTRGVALPMAIFALVVIGVLVGASFYIGRQEQAVGRNTVGMQQAFAAAEEGVQLKVATWDAALYNAKTSAPGTEWVIPPTTAGSGWYRGSVRRLNELLFLVKAEGFTRDNLSRQQVGMLLRLRPVELDVTAALKTQGNVTVTGSSVISGKDQVPDGWGSYPDCTAGDALPAIEWSGGAVTVSGSATISGKSTSSTACASCQPNPSLDTDAMLTLGDATFDEWREYATKHLTGASFSKVEPTTETVPDPNQPGASITRCNKGQSFNWGEPFSDVPLCKNYFPIIWVEGNADIQGGGRGQGVLLVNGNLSVQGSFQFFGPIIVKGSFYARGTGDQKFMGGVVAANVDVADETITGNARINYSSCAIERALSNSAPAFPLRSRSWANLY